MLNPPSNPPRASPSASACFYWLWYWFVWDSHTCSSYSWFDENSWITFLFWCQVYYPSVLLGCCIALTIKKLLQKYRFCSRIQCDYFWHTALENMKRFNSSSWLCPEWEFPHWGWHSCSPMVNPPGGVSVVLLTFGQTPTIENDSNKRLWFFTICSKVSGVYVQFMIMPTDLRNNFSISCSKCAFSTQ